MMMILSNLAISLVKVKQWSTMRLKAFLLHKKYHRTTSCSHRHNLVNMFFDHFWWLTKIGPIGFTPDSTWPSCSHHFPSNLLIQFTQFAIFHPIAMYINIYPSNCWIVPTSFPHLSHIFPIPHLSHGQLQRLETRWWAAHEAGEIMGISWEKNGTYHLLPFITIHSLVSTWFQWKTI